ncbi:hypothetical protein F4679DRAFT_590157 [Xylaria curta]|nr:hypothetical protein F4679DRAFT_590157 [Xylaria curta]
MSYHKRYHRAQRASNSVRARVPATTFTGFGRFPAELRLMIWEEFTRTPRVIRIDQSGKWDTKHREGQFAIKINGIIREQACPLLGVCHESRHVAMKSMLLFTISNDAEVHDGDYVGDRHFAIRSCDIVFFSGPSTRYKSLCGRGDTDKIANIMMGAHARTIRDSTDTAESMWKIWLEFAVKGFCLVKRLGNKEHLKKTYGLLHEDINSGAVKHFGMDDLGEFVPNYPPEYKRCMTAWLEHTFQEDCDYMGQEKMVPHLLMFQEKLTPRIKSKEVQVMRKK